MLVEGSLQLLGTTDSLQLLDSVNVSFTFTLVTVSRDKVIRLHGSCSSVFIAIRRILDTTNPLGQSYGLKLYQSLPATPNPELERVFLWLLELING